MTPPPGQPAYGLPLIRVEAEDLYSDSLNAISLPDPFGNVKTEKGDFGDVYKPAVVTLLISVLN
jgi:hypothetical protein